MELFSTDFFSALFAIIVIDLVLAGDNAIVIALAARSLPRHLQQRAVFWGTGGAIAARVIMTLAVVWLLAVPGLRLIGGLLLVWIAYRLLVPKTEDHAEHHVAPTVTFRSAIKTIVIADAVMGLDNVLGVAGAAKGSMVLVVLGLLISIPIMVLGSSLVLKWLDRFPWLIYAGAGVLAWTAAGMIMSEPLIGQYFAMHRAISWGFYVLAVGGLLCAGWWRNARRRQSAIKPK